MSLSNPPKAPNSGDGDGFAGDMNAWAPWFNDAAVDINALAQAFGPGSPYCSVSGSANALVLNSGLSLPALVVGQRVIFKPTGNSTGAVTINLDGLGAQPAKTVTGATCPATYLLAGTFVQAIWDGSVWVVSRDVERVTWSDGLCDKLPNGTVLMAAEVNETAVSWSTSSNGFYFRATAAVLTWPFTLLTAPKVVAGVLRNSAANIFGCHVLSATTTACELIPHCSSSVTASTSKFIHVEVNGRWY